MSFSEKMKLIQGCHQANFYFLHLCSTLLQLSSLSSIPIKFYFSVRTGIEVSENQSEGNYLKQSIILAVILILNIYVPGIPPLSPSALSLRYERQHAARARVTDGCSQFLASLQLRRLHVIICSLSPRFQI